MSRTRPTPPEAGLVKLFFHSPGGAALITVVLGGLVVGLVTAKLQRGLKEREIQLLYAQQISKGRIEIARELYLLTGRVAAMSSEVLALSTAEFEITPNMAPDRRRRLLEQRDQVLMDHNLFLRDWNSQREAIGPSLRFFYPCADALNDQWTEVENTAGSYLTCSPNAGDAQGVEQCLVQLRKLNSELDNISHLFIGEWKRSLRDPAGGWRAGCKEHSSITFRGATP